MLPTPRLKLSIYAGGLGAFVFAVLWSLLATLSTTNREQIFHFNLVFTVSMLGAVLCIMGLLDLWRHDVAT